MPTLKDVAKAAGVSVCTVSRVLNGSHVAGRISAECARKVMTAAEEVGYRPNYHARSLQTGASRTLGLLADPPKESADQYSFWGQMITGVEVEARVRGYDFLVVGQGRPDESLLQTGLRYLREHRIDGIVVPGYAFMAHSSPELHTGGLPVVLVHYSKKTRAPVVEVDDAAGVEAAVEHLAGLGHARAVWLAPPDDESPVAARRRRAFDKAVRAAGMRGERCALDAAAHADDDADSAAACAAMAHRLRKGDVTSVVCYNERVAFGAYAAIFSAGLRIPKDVSVVGFDDLCAHSAFPTMTVASHMLPEIGRRAAAIAIEMAGDTAAVKRYANRRERILSRLVVRSSTGPAPS